MNRHLRYMGAVAGVGAMYWLAAKGGLQLAYLHGTVSALWPPVGVGMALLILYGRSLGRGSSSETLPWLISRNPRGPCSVRRSATRSRS